MKKSKDALLKCVSCLSLAKVQLGAGAGKAVIGSASGAGVVVLRRSRHWGFKTSEGAVFDFTDSV